MAEALTILANLASIATAIVAVWFFALYQWGRRSKLRRLETYLFEEKASGIDDGKRSVLHLVAELGMSESEVMDAAFRSRVVRRVVQLDFDSREGMLMLEYDEDNPNSNRVIFKRRVS